MPKSKRSKVVTLSKTKAKDRTHKDSLIDNIRACIDKYEHVYTFTVKNVRTNILQQIRTERREDSRMFMGNNRVMMVALGKDEESSAAPNLHKLSRFLSGISGLFFTNVATKDIKQYISEVGGQDVYARAGSTASETVTIPAGPLSQFPHSMFDQLHRLGLNIKLDKGVILLLNDTTVCTGGNALTPEAAQVLKLFGKQMGSFAFELTSHWTNGVAKRITTTGEEGSPKGNASASKKSPKGSK